MNTVLDDIAQLRTTEAEKRSELRYKKPRVYEKIERFDAAAPHGAISPIIRLAWSYLCNFECDHCCAEHRMDRYLVKLTGKPEQRRRMNYEDLARISKEADEYGIYRFVLTGGEPTTWPDLFKVIEVLGPDRHLIISDSNAWLLAERKDLLQRLADAGLYKMQISLDSFVESEHDHFRNKPGSYKRVLRILPDIMNAGMKLLVSTCLVRGRVFTQEFEDLCKYCTGIGAMLYVTYAKPTGTCKQHQEDWVVEKRDCDRIRELEEKYDLTTHMTPSYMRDKNAGSAPLGHYDGCITVKGINTLEPTGDLVPCPYMDWAIGNIFDDSLAAIFQRGMRIKELGPQRNDCLIGEDVEFIHKHNAKVEERKSQGNYNLPVPWGEGWTNSDLIQLQV